MSGRDVKMFLRYYTKKPISDVGRRVAELLEEWQGLHHFEPSTLKRVDWSNTLFIELRLSRHDSGGQLSTFDFNLLTTLVFLAHDHCIRVHVEPCNPTCLRLIFHPRQAREGDMSRRHPTLEQTLAKWRERHAADLLPTASIEDQPAEQVREEEPVT